MPSDREGRTRQQLSRHEDAGEPVRRWELRPGRARPRGGFRVGPRPRDLLQGWLRRCRGPHVPHGARGRTPRGRWVAMPSAEASAPGAPARRGWRRQRPCSARQTADSSCCSLLVSAHTGDRGTDLLHAAHQPVLISWGHPRTDLRKQVSPSAQAGRPSPSPSRPTKPAALGRSMQGAGAPNHSR